MRLTQFEHVSQPVASLHVFFRRYLDSLGFVGVLLLVSLLVGAAGYWLSLDALHRSNAFYDAAMIMSGMGPVDHPAELSGKIFASLYALYSGLLLAVITGIVLAPLFHRILHHMLSRR
jgi:hypothetical protein